MIHGNTARGRVERNIFLPDLQIRKRLIIRKCELVPSHPSRDEAARWMGHRDRTWSELAAQEVFGFLNEDVAADVGDGVGEGDSFGADFYAVLREAALLHAAVAGERPQAIFL